MKSGDTIKAYFLYLLYMDAWGQCLEKNKNLLFQSLTIDGFIIIATNFHILRKYIYHITAATNK